MQLDHPKHILTPVDFSELSALALRYAAAFRACSGAQLTVLHVHEPKAQDAIHDLCAWIPAEQRAQCRIHELERRGEAAREIVAQAAEAGCDLLVIGAQHRRFFDSTVIGSTSVRVVRHAPCPVLTVVARQDNRYEPAHPAP